MQKLQHALGCVSRSITEVNESAEEHSTAIEDEKNVFLRLLEEDEKQNTAAVDGQRWSKLKILERQEQGLKGVVAMANRAIDLTTQSTHRLTDAQLLEMISIFEDGLLKAAKEAVQCHDPKVSTSIDYTHTWKRIKPPTPPPVQPTVAETLYRPPVAQCHDPKVSTSIDYTHTWKRIKPPTPPPVQPTVAETLYRPPVAQCHDPKMSTSIDYTHTWKRIKPPTPPPVQPTVAETLYRPPVAPLYHPPAVKPPVAESMYSPLNRQFYHPPTVKPFHNDALQFHFHRHREDNILLSNCNPTVDSKVSDERSQQIASDIMINPEDFECEWDDVVDCESSYGPPSPTQGARFSTPPPTPRTLLTTYEDAFPFHFGDHGDKVFLSNCNLTATSASPDETSHSSIVGSMGYDISDEGDVTWKILLEELSDSPGSSVHVGVTDRPDLLSSKNAWTWRNGKRRSPGSRWINVGGMPVWEEGDVLTFVLDYNFAPESLDLRIRKHGCVYSFSMYLIGHGGFVYPFFYVNCGQKITLLPCEQ